jgi:hypothetical protein
LRPAVLLSIGSLHVGLISHLILLFTSDAVLLCNVL